MSYVWCVWTESGEYDSFSRDLRGIFPTERLAEAHAAQIRAANDYEDVVEVCREEVLPRVPSRVPYIKRSAHILPDGAEDRGLGYELGKQFDGWSNEIAPLETARIGKWHGEKRGLPDLFVEVIGSDSAAVKAEYERLLAVARQRLLGDAEAQRP